MFFIEVKALAGTNYIRADQVLAVNYSDREKCNLIMAGGVLVSCVEAASVVAARIDAAISGASEKAAAPKGES